MRRVNRLEQETAAGKPISSLLSTKFTFCVHPDHGAEGKLRRINMLLMWA